VPGWREAHRGRAGAARSFSMGVEAALVECVSLCSVARQRRRGVMPSSRQHRGRTGASHRGSSVDGENAGAGALEGAAER
jgi:hypothetical protein